MKVILLKSQKGLGHAWQEIDAADGHAINFLIPRKIAVQATPALRQKAEAARKAEADKKMVDVKLVEERLAALAEERIVFKKKVNEKGHLYDGIDAKEIALMTKLPEDAISLEKPIKESGTFDIPVAFGENFGKISIVVEAE
ncbi:MAG: ribosomal protein L9 [Parcubacteria bacterium C7867-001]|nr:MAG: ribosomal protein L9 [Parcubacteria bacterium C7867-001]